MLFFYLKKFKFNLNFQKLEKQVKMCYLRFFNLYLKKIKSNLNLSLFAIYFHRAKFSQYNSAYPCNCSNQILIKIVLNGVKIIQV